MSVRVGTTDRAITAFGGAELLREAGRAVGLVEALDDCVSLKKRARGLSDTQFVMGMAETIAGARPCRVRQGCHRSFESPSLRSVALGVQACPATQGHLAGHGCPSRLRLHGLGPPRRVKMVVGLAELGELWCE